IGAHELFEGCGLLGGGQIARQDVLERPARRPVRFLLAGQVWDQGRQDDADGDAGGRTPHSPACRGPGACAGPGPTATALACSAFSIRLIRARTMTALSTVTSGRSAGTSLSITTPAGEALT